MVPLALQHQLEGLRRLGQLVHVDPADLAEPEEDRHLPLDVRRRDDAELALERRGQLAPAAVGLEQRHQRPLRAVVHRIELQRARVHAHRVVDVLEAVLVQLGEAARQLCLLGLGRDGGDLLQPDLGQLGPGLLLGQRVRHRAKVPRRLRRAAEGLHDHVPAPRLAGDPLDAGQCLLVLEVDRQGVAVRGDHRVGALLELLGEIGDLEVDAEQHLRLADVRRLLAEDADERRRAPRLAVLAGARLEGGRRARLDLEHALEGGQGGGVVPPLALLDSADLEQELGDAQLVLRQADRAVAQLDRAVPVARRVVEARQVVHHVRVVRPQRQRLLERLARPGVVLERAGVDVRQLAQDVESVPLVDAELGHLAQHLGELGSAIGAAEQHGEPDARAEVVGRAARRLPEQLFRHPLAPAHQLDGGGRAEVHAGGSGVALVLCDLGVEVGQLAALAGGPHEADQVVVPHHRVTVAGHRRLPQAEGAGQVAAAGLGDRRGTAERTRLAPAVAARQRLEVREQPGRVGVQQVPLDRALRLVVAGGGEDLPPELEAALRLDGPGVGQLGRAPAVGDRHPAGARAVGQLAHEVHRLGPAGLLQEEEVAGDDSDAGTPAEAVPLRRHRGGERRDRGERAVGVSHGGQVLDQEESGGGSVARRARVGLEEREPLGQSVADVGAGRRRGRIGEADLDGEPGQVEGDLGARLVGLQDDLGGALAIVEPVDQDVDRLGQAGGIRIARRLDQSVHQRLPVLGHGERQAERVVELDHEVARAALLGGDLEGRARALGRPLGVREPVEPGLGDVAQEEGAVERARPVGEPLDGGLRPIQVLGAPAGQRLGQDQAGRQRVPLRQLEVAGGSLAVVGQVPGEQREPDVHVGEDRVGIAAPRAGQEGLALGRQDLHDLVDETEILRGRDTLRRLLSGLEMGIARRRLRSARRRRRTLRGPARDRRWLHHTALAARGLPHEAVIVTPVPPWTWVGCRISAAPVSVRVVRWRRFRSRSGGALEADIAGRVARRVSFSLVCQRVEWRPLPLVRCAWCETPRSGERCGGRFWPAGLLSSSATPSTRAAWVPGSSCSSTARCELRHSSRT